VTVEYVIRRLVLFVVIIWVAATLNFFLPRLSGTDPIRARLLEQAAAGGYVQAGLEDMVEEYNKKFGLDRPLYEQYFTYLGDIVRLDFGYSIVNYPRTVMSMMGDALPWTVGLLLTTTLLAFVIGTLLGALLAWPRAPRFIHALFPPLLTFSSIPYFLLGLVLLYLFAFKLSWLPLFGGYSAGSFPEYSASFAWDVFKHSLLPAFSILLASMGFWALGMRGMMVTVEGEDYMTFAEASGLMPLGTHCSRRQPRSGSRSRRFSQALSWWRLSSRTLVLVRRSTLPFAGMTSFSFKVSSSRSCSASPWQRSFSI
jgi:peptide/nickel transport system permease protein